jgi:HEAT repeat protein
MMTSPDQTIRQLAEFALVGTQDREGSSLLQAEYMIRKTNEGGGKFGTGPENAEELIAGLKEVREHPLVAARLVETVISGSSGAYYAAMVLQGTPDKATERSLKHALSAALDRGFGAGFELRDMWQVPRALKYSQDPDTQALIIRALKEGDEAFGTNNLRFQAACAMGAINTSEVRALAIEKVMSTRQDWGVRRGIAQAIRELDAEEVDARILPLIEGSDLKTAWILAGEQRSNGLGRVAKWVSLISSEREVVHDIRVQVGLALQERHPDLAAKVFDDALKGERNPFKHRCQFFAAGDALRALQAREATT